jgi:hypothetical protein
MNHWREACQACLLAQEPPEGTPLTAVPARLLGALLPMELPVLACADHSIAGLEGCKEASQVTLRGSFSAIGISLWDDTYGRKPLRRSQH